jgi:hypothetical protein
MEIGLLRRTIYGGIVRPLLLFLPCLDPRRSSLKRFSNIVCTYRLLAVLFIIFSLVSFLVTAREIIAYQSVPGVVTRIVVRHEDVCVNSDFTTVSPECIEERYIVRFQTRAGQRIETTFTGAGKDSVPKPGDRFLVGYDPADPKGTAMDYGALRWDTIFGWIMGALGICALLIDWGWHKFVRKMAV